MASRFFQCICGKFATIDMGAWVNGVRVIECQCGHKLNADEGVFGFPLAGAHLAWAEYMREEIQKGQADD